MGCNEFVLYSTYFTCLCLAPGHSKYNWHNIIFMYWSVELYAPTMHMRWEHPSVLYIMYNYNIICTHVTSIIPKCDPIIRLRYSKCHTFIFWRFRDMVCKNMQLIFSFKKMHCSPTYHKWPKCRLSISDKWGTHFLMIITWIIIAIQLSGIHHWKAYVFIYIQIYISQYLTKQKWMTCWLS